jgi:hypothetical protein
MFAMFAGPSTVLSESATCSNTCSILGGAHDKKGLDKETRSCRGIMHELVGAMKELEVGLRYTYLHSTRWVPTST